MLKYRTAQFFELPLFNTENFQTGGVFDVVDEMFRYVFVALFSGFVFMLFGLPAAGISGSDSGLLLGVVMGIVSFVVGTVGHHFLSPVSSISDRSFIDRYTRMESSRDLAIKYLGLPKKDRNLFPVNILKTLREPLTDEAQREVQKAMISVFDSIDKRNALLEQQNLTERRVVESPQVQSLVEELQRAARDVDIETEVYTQYNSKELV